MNSRSFFVAFIGRATPRPSLAAGWARPTSRPWPSVTAAVWGREHRPPRVFHGDAATGGGSGGLCRPQHSLAGGQRQCRLIRQARQRQPVCCAATCKYHSVFHALRNAPALGTLAAIAVCLAVAPRIYSFGVVISAHGRPGTDKCLRLRWNNRARSMSRKQTPARAREAPAMSRIIRFSHFAVHLFDGFIIWVCSISVGRSRSSTSRRKSGLLRPQLILNTPV